MTAQPAQEQQKIGSGTTLALIAMGLSVIVLAQDFSAVNVALPAIEKQFDSDISTVQWVINAYGLVFGMLIVTGGRLADQFGRRLIFFIGTTIFAVMSLIAGAAPNEYFLIGARALMGIGGALMWPAILGMTYAALPQSKAGLAGGLIIGAAGIGQALGPINGGALTELLSWRWIQYVNVPIAAFAMFVTWRELPADKPVTKGARLDYAGIVTLSISLVALLFALDQATEWGWTDPRIIGCLVIFVALMAAFLLVERRAGANALVPADVMANRQFAAACVAIALVAPSFFAALLYVPQFMEKILGFSPLRSGVGLLPMMVMFAGVSFIGGQLYDKLGARLMVSIGAAGLALGPLLLSFMQTDSSYGVLVPGMVVLGLGLGFFFSSATTAGVQAVDPSRTSLAGGLVYMFQIAGGSVGLGLTTTVIAASSQSRVDADLKALGATLTQAQLVIVHGIMTGTDSAMAAVSQLSPQVAERIPTIVKDAFVHGIQAGLRLDAALAFGAFLIAVLLIRNTPTAGDGASKPPSGG